MNAIKNIEVTVKYEVSPATELEAALERYKEADKALKLIDKEATPIIKEIGEKKIDCILKQIEPLFNLSEIICAEKKVGAIFEYLKHPDCKDHYFDKIKLLCKGYSENKLSPKHIQIKYGNCFLPIDDPTFLKEDSILSHWEEWGIYKALERKVIWYMNAIAEDKVSKAQSINNTLKQFIAHN